MSRVAKEPVELPQGVEFNKSGTTVSVKGGNGSLSMELNSEVELAQEDNMITVKPRSGSRFSNAIAGTTRALLANMVVGVTSGFEKKLELKGVGYRAITEGKKLNLTLGFSHPVVFEVPDGITRVMTNRGLARWPPKFVLSGRRSRTRARVCATPMSA
jgi:large subunit ribosomal protein L6